ncbi:GDCCVxC domain-containing (seleno)protein [Spirosoma spitsbergense]|uniref:GDCCVxC domain-containing (seleno)protein n=1 Tax=Spirosoma spitsbergense TaxID=431554 RepID=UPI000A06EBEF|nr:GDCCVxC domain-containing (seleno)protein [Spirosoma spitsbergense]
MNEIHNTYGIYQGKTVILNSRITCPRCGYQQDDLMPIDACVYFYECHQCQAILKPLPGHCCVYCSYGTVACPPIQAGTSCCS